MVANPAWHKSAWCKSNSQVITAAPSLPLGGVVLMLVDMLLSSELIFIREKERNYKFFEMIYISFQEMEGRKGCPPQ